MYPIVPMKIVTLTVDLLSVNFSGVKNPSGSSPQIGPSPQTKETTSWNPKAKATQFQMDGNDDFQPFPVVKILEVSSKLILNHLHMVDFLRFQVCTVDGRNLGNQLIW